YRPGARGNDLRSGRPSRPYAARTAGDPRERHPRMPIPRSAGLWYGSPWPDEPWHGMVGTRAGCAGGSDRMEPDGPSRWRGEAPVSGTPDRGRGPGRSRSWSRTAPVVARPLFRPAPRSAMVFPLVVLVAVLPGLVALNAWDLTPPGPLWGLRGLAVLDGMVLDQMGAAETIKPVQESAAYRAVAVQPPLYAWLDAALFGLGPNRDPLASVLPSYVAGVLAVVLVYLHGQLWRGAGLALTAAILVAFNQNLLLRMQEATPSTLALCGVLAVLLAHGWHERLLVGSMR